MYAISAAGAPHASKPFSEGTSAARYVFVSAQLPVDPKTNELIEGSLVDMANQCIDNVEVVLSELDLTLSDVTKVTVTLAGTSDYAAVDEVCAKRFPKPMPACSRMEVVSLPRGARLAVEAIACR